MGYDQFEAGVKKVASKELSMEDFVKSPACKKYLKTIPSAWIEDGEVIIPSYPAEVGDWGVLEGEKVTFNTRSQKIQCSNTLKEQFGILSPLIECEETDDRRVEYRFFLSLENMKYYMSPAILHWDHTTQQLSAHTTHPLCIKHYEFDVTPEGKVLSSRGELQITGDVKLLHAIATLDDVARYNDRTRMNERIVNQAIHVLFDYTKGRPGLQIKGFFEGRKDEIIDGFNTTLKTTYKEAWQKDQQALVWTTALNDWMNRFYDYTALGRINDKDAYMEYCRQNLESREIEIQQEALRALDAFDPNKKDAYPPSRYGVVPMEIRHQEDLHTLLRERQRRITELTPIFNALERYGLPPLPPQYDPYAHNRIRPMTALPV